MSSRVETKVLVSRRLEHKNKVLVLVLVLKKRLRLDILGSGLDKKFKNVLRSLRLLPLIIVKCFDNTYCCFFLFTIDWHCVLRVISNSIFFFAHYPPRHQCNESSATGVFSSDPKE